MIFEEKCPPTTLPCNSYKTIGTCCSCGIYVKISICGSIRAVVGKTPLIWCESLAFYFNSLLMQKLEVGTIPGFGNLASYNLQRFVGFFVWELVNP
jgi:hypothetical protein